MVDIQCPTAEIRRGNKKRRRKKSQDENIYVRILLCRAAIKKIDRKKPQGKNIMSASATQGGHNNTIKIEQSSAIAAQFCTRWSLCL